MVTKSISNMIDSLLLLPNEILMLILKILSVEDMLRLSQTCHIFHEKIFNDNTIFYFYDYDELCMNIIKKYGYNQRVEEFISSNIKKCNTYFMSNPYINYNLRKLMHIDQIINQMFDIYICLFTNKIIFGDSFNLPIQHWMIPEFTTSIEFGAFEGFAGKTSRSLQKKYIFFPEPNSINY